MIQLGYKITFISAILLFSINFMIKAQSKETTMQATGIFDVTLIPQNDEIAPVGRMVIHKEYQGDLEGSGNGQMLSKRTNQNTAAYSAIEEFKGTLDGKKGSFTLIHQGFMSPVEQQLTVTILSGSGTDELENIQGELNINQQNDKHEYVLTYHFEVQKKS